MGFVMCVRKGESHGQSDVNLDLKSNNIHTLFFSETSYALYNPIQHPIIVLMTLNI